MGAQKRWLTGEKRPWRYVSATAVVAVAAGVCWLLQPFLLAGSLVLPFLIAIMLTAVAYGLPPSLFASVLSVLTFDFFFLPPLYSLNIAEPDDVLRLVIFALAALIVSNLAAYARGQAVTASQRAAVAEDLYRFSRQLTGAATLAEVMDSSLPRLTAMLRAPLLIAVRDGDNVTVYPEDQPQPATLAPPGAGRSGPVLPGSAAPATALSETAAPGTAASGTAASGTALPRSAAPGTALSDMAAPGTAASGMAASAMALRGSAAPGTALSDLAAPDLAAPGTELANPGAESAITGTEFALIKSCIKSWLQREPVPGSDTHPPISSRWLFVPMRTGRGEVGMMAIAREALDSLPVPNSEALVGTLADLMAQAIDRIALVEDLNRASRAAEREELHAALLASLSHDLRTPLASVLVDAESLIAQPDGPRTETHQALARSIQAEARRLDRYIGNLLDMTRIETGLADATESRIDLADAVSVALDRCARSLHRHRLTIALAEDLPLLAGDEVLLEHVLFNLLDNAAKYTPPGSLVELRAWRDQDSVVIEVADDGEGIRPADLERIFDKFYRSERPGRKSPGIGLGLSICRGYIEAMGGHITARNRSGPNGTVSGTVSGTASGAVFTITLPVPEMEDLPDLDA